MKKRITAIIITLAMLCAVSCNKTANEPANTTAGTTATEVTTGSTTETTVGETTEVTEETTETAAVTEVTTDINAMLEGYTVYEVTTEHVMYTLNADDPDNAYDVQLREYHTPLMEFEERWQKGDSFSEKIAVRFTDLDGLTLFVNMWTKEKGFFHEITHMTYGKYVVECSKPLDYSQRWFGIDVADDIIAVKGDYSSDYYFIATDGYVKVPARKTDGNVTGRIDLFESAVNENTLMYTYTNELFCDVHSLGGELRDDYNSEDDLYMEYGKVVLDNGVPYLETTGRETIGEWYQSDDFPYPNIRDEYGFETLRDMAKRFKSTAEYQEFIRIYEELERGKNDN